MCTWFQVVVSNRIIARWECGYGANCRNTEYVQLSIAGVVIAMGQDSGATGISFRGGGGGSELWERAPRYYG